MLTALTSSHVLGFMTLFRKGRTEKWSYCFPIKWKLEWQSKRDSWLRLAQNPSRFALATNFQPRESSWKANRTFLKILCVLWAGSNFYQKSLWKVFSLMETVTPACKQHKLLGHLLLLLLNFSSFSQRLHPLKWISPFCTVIHSSSLPPATTKKDTLLCAPYSSPKARCSFVCQTNLFFIQKVLPSWTTSTCYSPRALIWSQRFYLQFF